MGIHRRFVRICPPDRSFMQNPIFIAAIAAILSACAGMERETRAAAEPRAITFEVRRVDDTPGALESALVGIVPDDSELYIEQGNFPLLLKKQAEISNTHLQDAQLGLSEERLPAIYLRLNAEGQRIFCAFTRQHIGKRIAILFIEEGRGEVLVAPVIRNEICGGNLQITGGKSRDEFHQIAQRLRSGISAGK
jgi:preprotein translocase subunit SecD